jgi:hypothetical protein
VIVVLFDRFDVFFLQFDLQERNYFIDGLERVSGGLN